MKNADSSILMDDFMKMLNAIEDSVVEKIEDYQDEAYQNYPNFPVIDYNLIIMDLNETGYEILDAYCDANPDFENARYNWLMEIGKKHFGDDFLDFANLSEEDQAYLQRTYTYFEDIEEENIRRKEDITDEDGKSIFNLETGEIVDKNLYSYDGEGSFTNLKTGESFEC